MMYFEGNLMTLEQLQTLVQIVKTGSMGTTAKALQRTWSTLSISVKKLEQELNVELSFLNCDYSSLKAS